MNRLIKLLWWLDRKFLLPLTHSKGLGDLRGSYGPRKWAARLGLIGHPWLLWCGCGSGMETWEELRRRRCVNCIMIADWRVEE